MRHIQMAIDQRLVDGHPVPGDLHELETELSSLPKNPAIADQYYKDGWMHPIVLRRLADPAVPYELASAGPDGQFGTEDDMVMQSQIKMEQQKPEEKPTSRRQKELP